MKDAIARADACSSPPDYNDSIPGVTRNALDWLTRPASDIARVFGGKPVARTGASTPGFGMILSRNTRLPVLRTLGAESPSARNVE